jgi:F-type H+-transporting ATPase subunit delta
VISGTLARRYAKALLELAPSPAARDKYADDLAAFADVTRLRDGAGLQVLTALTLDRFPVAQRRALLDALAGRLGTDPQVRKFLVLVLQRGRLDGIVQIARAYRTLADQAAGRLRGVVTSAQPLPPDRVAALTSALAAATGKQIALTTAVDPALIGGVTTQVGSYLIDGSVRTALARMRSALRPGS